MPWSLSRLKTFEQCHAKYNFQYKLKLDRGPSGSAAERGVRIHKEIEDAIRGVSTLPAESSLIAPHIAGIELDGITRMPEHQIFLDREWKQVIAGDYWYHGIIDLLVLPNETEAHVWDWKTGKVYDDHNMQRELYATAVMSVWPKIETVKTYWAYLDLKKIIPKEFTRGWIDGYKTKWTARADAMEQSTDATPNPQFLCRYCNYSQAKGGPCKF